MVNFRPLAAEIVSLVWGTPANFNGFGVLAALLDGTLVIYISMWNCRKVRRSSIRHLSKQKVLDDVRGNDSIPGEFLG